MACFLVRDSCTNGRDLLIMATTLEQIFGQMLLPPTPQPAVTFESYKQSVNVWTRQVEQTFRQVQSVIQNLDTAQIPEGSGSSYWSQELFDSAFAAKTTDDLTEGVTNLYFTIARARAALSATAPITYNSTSGAIGLTTPLAVSYGGTGLATANPTSAFVTDNSGIPYWTSGTTANRILRTDGTTISFSQLVLSTDVTGVLPVSNGGTGTSNRTLVDSSVVVSLNWEARSLLDSTGTGALFWSSRALADSLGVAAENWDNRELYDAFGSTAVSWGARSLIDGSQMAVDWANRLLVYSSGDTAVAWEAGEIYGGLTDLSIHFKNRKLYASASASDPVLDWEASQLLSGGTLVFDWDASHAANRFLASPSGGAGLASMRAIVAADLPLISLTSGVTDTLPVANGGTGFATYSGGDMLYASGSTSLAKLASVATGNAIISGGVGIAPSWGKIGLTTHVSGTLAATNGGTGTATVTTGDLLYGSASNVWSKLAGVATGNALISGGVGVAPSWGKIALTTHVSGTLPVGNGGTGVTTFGGTNRLLYTTATDTLSSITTANSSVLVTSAGGVPSWSTQLPDHLGVGIAADSIGSIKTLNAIWCGGGDGSGVGSPSAFGFSVYTGLILGHGNSGALFACGRGSLVLHPFTGFTGYDWGSLGAGVGRTLYFGGGGWDAPDANYHEFWTAPTYTETKDTAVMRMKIWHDGTVSIGGGSQPGALLEVIGKTYIGTSSGTTATAKLHIGAGSATANTAPLKFTSGTNLTTAEAGAMEYNGTNLFFTRAGTTRENVVCASAVTTEAVTSDTTVTVNINGTTYKLLAKA